MMIQETTTAVSIKLLLKENMIDYTLNNQQEKGRELV